MKIENAVFLFLACKEVVCYWLMLFVVVIVNELCNKLLQDPSMSVQTRRGGVVAGGAARPLCNANRDAHWNMSWTLQLKLSVSIHHVLLHIAYVYLQIQNVHKVYQKNNHNFTFVWAFIHFILLVEITKTRTKANILNEG